MVKRIISDKIDFSLQPPCYLFELDVIKYMICHFEWQIMKMHLCGINDVKLDNCVLEGVMLSVYDLVESNERVVAVFTTHDKWGSSF